MIRRIWLATLLCVLVACTTAPKTPRQYFAATYQAISAAAESLATLAEAKTIKPEDALSYLDKLDSAKRLTDEGRVIMQCREAIKSGIEADTKCGTEAIAQGKVKFATSVINSVQLLVDRHK